MSSLYGDAQEWARDQSLASVPRLAQLEAVAFRESPEIVATLGADGAAIARRAGSRSVSARLRGWLIVLLGCAGLVAPLAGVAMYSAGRSFLAVVDPLPLEISIPGTGICFAITALMQLALWAFWLREGARWDPAVLGIALIAAVLAGFAAAAGAKLAGPAGVDPRATLSAVWAALLIAALLVLAVGARFRHRAPEPEDTPPAADPDAGTRARAAVMRLPSARRETIQRERDEALRILAERGLLDEPELRRTLAAELGTLFTLDPIRGGSPPGAAPPVRGP